MRRSKVRPGSTSFEGLLYIWAQVLAVGLANVFSGLLGGFPACASMTAVNVKTGAKSRFVQV